jgi:hypothetical protein
LNTLICTSNLRIFGVCLGGSPKQTQKTICTSDLNWTCFQRKEAMEVGKQEREGKSQESVGLLKKFM